MSYIATLEGNVQYDSDDDFKSAVRKLREQGFYSVVTANPSQNEIVLEYDSYRNLGRNLHFLFDTASSGRVVGVSADVSWHGFVTTPETETETNLEKWAEEHGLTADRPEKEDFETEDDWWEEYTDWQADVESEFMEENL